MAAMAAPDVVKAEEGMEGLPLGAVKPVRKRKDRDDLDRCALHREGPPRGGTGKGGAPQDGLGVCNKHAPF